MRISWNWLSELIDLSGLEGPQALADLLTSRGLEVESIERLDQGLDRVITAQILEFKPHPEADRLNLCQVSTGQGSPIEIVCGAPNVKAGAKVALAQVGAHLPNGLKIAISKIRGVTSNGMLCSQQELGLSEESAGIIILPDATPLGLPIAQVLGRNDIILTLKLTANRGDCLGHFGIAREVGAAIGKKPKLTEAAPIPSEKSPITISLEAGDIAPQFFGYYVQGVKIGPSPDWMVKRLETLGHRSINNVVDASNIVMLETGYPTHAFDADKIRGDNKTIDGVLGVGKIIVRRAKAGESLPLLDGTTLTLDGSEIVIADHEGPISLAGIMGGGNSEVHNDTQNLFLECAEFDPTLIRKVSSRYQKKTDAAHRFERGVDPLGARRALPRLVHLVQQVAGGKVLGATHALLPSREANSKVFKKEVRFALHYINEFLGFEKDQEPLTLQTVQKILEGLDCKVERNDKEWVIQPPSYRLDLNIREDFVEEVARSLGYDKIPATLPPLSGTPVFSASSLPRVKVIDRAKESLVRSGLHETINFAFTSKAWLSRFGLSSSVPLLNPLSEEYEAMVPSLLPGLVRNALDNWNKHFGSEPLAIRLFELRPTFSATGSIQAQGQMETGVTESWKLSLALSGPRFSSGLRFEQGEVDFYDLKAVIDSLLTALGTRGVRFIPFSASRTGGHPLFHPGQSAEILVGNSVAGHFGLLHPGKSRELKARAPLWIAELDWEVLSKLSRKASEAASFQAWSEYPPMERDFALLVKNDVTAEKLCQVALKAGKPLAKVAKIFDVYRGSQVAEGMTSVAIRVIFYNEQRSLQESETEAASAKILDSWKKELGAELRS